MALDPTAGLRVAVLGGGVAGAAFVYGLSRPRIASPPISSPSPSPSPPPPPLGVTLFEMGRAAGGRTATRFTRDIPDLRVNHGAPHFDVRDPRFSAVIGELEAGGFVGPVKGPCGVLQCAGDAQGAFQLSAPAPGAPLYAGTPSMNALCAGLLHLSGGGAECRYSTMVRGLEWIPGGGWRLFDKEQQPLGEFDWLAISSSGLCHPRWTKAFGGPPPMLEAAKAVGDPALDRALASIGGIYNRPVTAVMMAFGGDAAAAWGALPWAVAEVRGDDDIAKVMVERLDGGLVTVVVHSTQAFSEKVVDVYGAKSTAARVGGAGSSAEREAEVVEDLMRSLRRRLVPGLLPAAAFDAAPAWGAHLHRWGAAFPAEGGLPPGQAVAPDARVVFMGDFVGGAPTGRVEDAAVSGLAAADAILSHAAAPRM